MHAANLKTRKIGMIGMSLNLLFRAYRVDYARITDPGAVLAALLGADFDYRVCKGRGGQCVALAYLLLLDPFHRNGELKSQQSVCPVIMPLVNEIAELVLT